MEDFFLLYISVCVCVLFWIKSLVNLQELFQTCGEESLFSSFCFFPTAVETNLYKL